MDDHAGCLNQVKIAQIRYGAYKCAYFDGRSGRVYELMQGFDFIMGHLCSYSLQWTGKTYRRTNDVDSLHRWQLTDLPT